MATAYTTQEEQDVYYLDEIFVALTGAASKVLLHQYKKRNDNRTDRIKVRVDLKSTLAPSTSTIYLQMWNGSSWTTLDSNSTKAANLMVSLLGDVSETSYYDFGEEVAVRVYQQNDATGSQTLSIDLVKISFIANFAAKYTDIEAAYVDKYDEKDTRFTDKYAESPRDYVTKYPAKNPQDEP